MASQRSVVSHFRWFGGGPAGKVKRCIPTSTAVTGRYSPRAAGFGGRFVTAVLTTGIYCGQSCPVRLPSEGGGPTLTHSAYNLIDTDAVDMAFERERCPVVVVQGYR
jgi:hypothetical protein